jgi:hypothetical protein
MQQLVEAIIPAEGVRLNRLGLAILLAGMGAFARYGYRLGVRNRQRIEESGDVGNCLQLRVNTPFYKWFATAPFLVAALFLVAAALGR